MTYCTSEVFRSTEKHCRNCFKIFKAKVFKSIISASDFLYLKKIDILRCFSSMQLRARPAATAPRGRASS
jgi:hypothetical protein